MKVTISPGNSKMGEIKSISLPPGVTCKHDCECYIKCYARRLMAFRKSVAQSYERNLKVLLREPETYWREVEIAIKTSRLFRFHVAGDILDGDYFLKMVGVADRNPHCDILCFTKQYEIVNAAIDNGVKLPSNLHILFSAWRNMEMKNPYNLPEAHVHYRDGFTTAREDAKPCGGNCTECSVHNGGCWTLKRGEQVVINEH